MLVSCCLDLRPEAIIQHPSLELQEAQNAVATRALFWLFPELPLYRNLPEPYRTMCMQWLAEGLSVIKSTPCSLFRSSCLLRISVGPYAMNEVVCNASRVF